MRALVIGGSGDIGQQITWDLLCNGYSVCATFNDRNPASLFSHPDLQWQKMDCRIGTELRSRIDSLGDFDCLIHAAGVVFSDKIENQNDDSLREMLSVNLESAIIATSVMFPKMIERRFGRLIFLGSIIGRVGGVGLSAYASTKSGLEGFVKSIHKEIVHERQKKPEIDLTVNLMRPGYVESEMTKAMNSRIKEKVCERSTLSRLLSPKEISSFALFLLRAENAYLSGGMFDVDGGQLI